MPPLAEEKIDESARKLSAFRQKNELPDILTDYEMLLDAYRNLKSDFEEERESRERYKKIAKGQNSNPFVLVLVDGDGYVPDDSFLKKGAEGGPEFATLLNNRIRSLVVDKGLEDVKIMVRIYANVCGLSKALSKASLSGADKRSLAPFIANFNRSYPLSDFVDAGEYKENADFKLRGLLRLYAENTQCKHLFFAACHDSGYVSELTQYRGQTDRFTLIKTPGLLFHDEFNKLGLRVEELRGVFRPTDSAMNGPYPKPGSQLVSSIHNVNTKAAAAAAYPSSPVHKQSSAGETICHFWKAGKCRYGSQCKNLHPDTQLTGIPMRSTIKLTRENWRSEPSLDPKQLPVKIPEGFVAVNKTGHRLDVFNEPSTPEMEQRLKIRSNEQRLCNSMHLFGSCNNQKCEYDHRPLDPYLKPTLEILARSVPCTKRGLCRNARCTFGHVCQKTDCSRRGGKNYCKLGHILHIDDMYPFDFIPAAKKEVKDSGSYGDGRLEQSSSPDTPSSPNEDDFEDDEDQGAAMYE